jgi:3-methylfumaryl-CoA hydratase
MEIIVEDPPLVLKPSASSIRTEICSIASVRRVAAMLDLEPDAYAEETSLPRGWQFILMAADTRRSALRADGFPGLGVTMPDLGLPRLLLGSRSVDYCQDIPIGSRLTRQSAIKDITQKVTKSGPMAVVSIQHELRLTETAQPALIETQTYLLLPATRGAAVSHLADYNGPVKGQVIKTVVPDETLLFQYSALGFNSHKIHIDRAHARNVEGFPDLIVNGGLVTLLLTEFLRNEIGVKPSALRVRHLAPLYCGSPITMVANQVNSKWHLQAFDIRSILSVDMEVETHGL